MENRKNGFASYLDNLYQETQEQVQQSDAQPEAGLPVGAVVMNANPFTLGPVSYTHLDVYKRQRSDRSVQSPVSEG